MRRLVSCCVLLLAGLVPLAAAEEGEAAPVITVTKALVAPEDDWVVLCGVIEADHQGDHYTLRDPTGVIAVEVPEELRDTHTLEAGERVRIHGQIDIEDEDRRLVSIRRLDRLPDV